MKKKLLLLSTILVVPFSMSLIACDKEQPVQPQTEEEGPKEHTTHSWKKEWAYDDENHWLQCSVCDATSFKGPHTWDEGTITTPATQTSDGIKTFVCGRCGATKTSPVSFEDTHIHSWGEGMVTTPATETEKGVKTFTCSICGQTKTESIPALGTGDSNEVDGYVLVESIDDTDNLYIISSADGITYNAMTAETKGETLPWYFVYAITDYELTKNGIVELENKAEQFKITKQDDGSYIIQTKNGLYVYSYVDGSHYSIGLCNSIAADKGGTVYWVVSKKGNGFIFKGKTTNVYLTQSSQSFCGNKEEPTFPIYLFEPGKSLFQMTMVQTMSIQELLLKIHVGI